MRRLRRLGRAMQMEIKEHKSSFIVYAILRLMMRRKEKVRIIWKNNLLIFFKQRKMCKEGNW